MGTKEGNCIEGVGGAKGREVIRVGGDGRLRKLDGGRWENKVQWQ